MSRLVICSFVLLAFVPWLCVDARLDCSWNVKYNFDMGGSFHDINITAELRSYLRLDTRVGSSGFGVYPRTLQEILSYQRGVVSRSGWRQSMTEWQNAHSTKLRADLMYHNLTNFTGKMCHDYESWAPSWVVANSSGPQRQAWIEVVQNLTMPTFDNGFLSLVGFEAPPGTTGWAQLSYRGKEQLLQKTWVHFSQLFWNTTLDVSRSVAPHALWGAWNVPRKWGPATADATGGRPTPEWMAHDKELSWLYSQFDAFYLDLYPEIFVGHSRPADLSARCGVHNHSENLLYYESNIQYAQQLRAQYAPHAKIFPYLWWHYMCDHNFNATHLKFIDQDNIDTPFAVADGLGVQGIVLYGSVAASLPDHTHPSDAAILVNTRYVDVITQHCNRLQ